MMLQTASPLAWMQTVSKAWRHRIRAVQAGTVTGNGKLSAGLYRRGCRQDRRPHLLEVLLGRENVSDADAHDDPSVELGMGEVGEARCIDRLDDALVDPIGCSPVESRRGETEAHDRHH